MLPAAALLALQAAPAVVGGVQAITGAKKSDLEKNNKLKIRELEANPGLTSQDRSALYQQLVMPSKQAAAELQRSAGAQMAASGATSGADVSQVRKDAADTAARGAERASAGVAEADVGRRAEQKGEIAQRGAADQAYKQQRRATAFNALAQAAGIAGDLAGAPPAMQLAGMFGTRRDSTAEMEAGLKSRGFSPEASTDMAEMERRAPGQTAAMQRSLYYDIAGPESDRSLAKVKPLEADPTPDESATRVEMALQGKLPIGDLLGWELEAYHVLKQEG